MTTRKAEIVGIAPFFIVKNVPTALSFYRDKPGFDIIFQGPEGVSIVIIVDSLCSL